jgi:hypothetical protein
LGIPTANRGASAQQYFIFSDGLAKTVLRTIMVATDRTWDWARVEAGSIDDQPLDEHRGTHFT